MLTPVNLWKFIGNSSSSRQSAPSYFFPKCSIFNQYEQFCLRTIEGYLIEGWASVWRGKDPTKKEGLKEYWLLPIFVAYA